jgi:hypothetical protein
LQVTPEEKWNGRKPDISNFKIFGSECWGHILNDKRKKLEPKSHKCIFIGYNKDSKDYMLFDTSTHGVIIWFDVQFNEVSPSPESLEPHVTFNFPSSLVTPILFIPFSISVPNIDPISPTSSSDPPKCSKDNRVVPSTTPLPIWARKTLEFAGSEIGIPSNTR